MIVDQTIVNCFDESPPRREPPKQASSSASSSSLQAKHDNADALASQLITAHLEHKYQTMDVLGKSSFNILARQQWYSAADDGACKLIDMYFKALDAAKTGDKVDIKELQGLCITEWPLYMEGRSKDPKLTYVEVPKSLCSPTFGVTALMKLFKNGALGGCATNSAKVDLDPQLRCTDIDLMPEDEGYLARLKQKYGMWLRHHQDYCEKITQLLKLEDEKDRKAQVRRSPQSLLTIPLRPAIHPSSIPSCCPSSPHPSQRHTRIAS